MNLEELVTNWIQEECDSLREQSRPVAVAIHMLLVKTSLMNRDEASLTESVELSLQVFDRSQLYKTLRRLYEQRVIQFVTQEGEEQSIPKEELLAVGAGESKLVKFVKISG